MRRDLALLTAALVACGACATRERANPFDPANQQTGGRPVGFVAFAGDHRVDLTWMSVAGVSLEGYQIFRSLDGSTYDALSAVLPPTTTRYRDFGLLNGVDHFYRLYYVIDGSIGNDPASDVATPGPLTPWVIDFVAGRLDLLAADGRHALAQLGGLEGPTAVATDTVRGLVWISDRIGGRVLIHQPTTRVTITIPGLVAPGALAVNPADSSAWVCDEGGGRVHHFRATGDPIGLPVEPLIEPIGVAIDRTDASIWICERGGNRVSKRNETGGPVWSLVIDRPSRVAVDQVTRSGWVTSFTNGTVHHVASDARILNTLTGFSGPIGVAVDGARSTVWVADASAHQVVALDVDGTELFRVSDLDECRELVVDPATGDCWVVLPGSGEVARISSAGLVTRRVGGFVAPYGIALDRGVILQSPSLARAAR